MRRMLQWTARRYEGPSSRLASHSSSEESSRARVCTHKSPEAGYGTATSLVCCRCGDLHSGRVPWLESSQCRMAHSRGSIDIPRRSRDFLEPRICEQIAPGAISPYRGESAGKPDCGPKSCRLGCLHTGA